ncbi:hypothetical protein J2X46_003473 [Nocardioides sp. BE266]|uniref:DUF3105 domain-containing protein n=1 Tax=Nocardioides sp. BE266 TaxID=2817725 RepID=UPI002854C1F5|nr:DUF3105 domain-containing protein [Nocardioides sp. BE266]MDR7254480.1 hypothetical protein [Nocardioides sp. BE266]
MSDLDEPGPETPEGLVEPPEDDVVPGLDVAPDDDGEERTRLPLALAGAAAVLIMGAALVAPLVDQVLRGDEEAQRAQDLSLVETWDITDRSHTMSDVHYPQTPPAGGPHAPVWLACGVYDEAVRDENAVHDLEHGTVWITHDPGLPADDIERLAAELPDNGIMSPREGLPSPVVVTVWGAQLQLDGADDDRLALFLEEYADGHTAPEFGVTCQGGTTDPQGGLPEQGTNA